MNLKTIMPFRIRNLFLFLPSSLKVAFDLVYTGENWIDRLQDRSQTGTDQPAFTWDRSTIRAGLGLIAKVIQFGINPV